MNRLPNKKQTGFTLMEIMIALVIIGLLMAAAVTQYQSQIRRTARADAQSMLQNAAVRQERFFSRNSTYTADPAELGTKAGGLSENDYYALTVAPCAGGSIAACYTLTATAQAGTSQANDAGCTTITLNSFGQKAPAACW